MAKFYVTELIEDNYDDNIQNRLGYYFIAYRNDDNVEVKCPGCVADEFNITLEDYVKICKDNGAINFNNYSEVEDLFYKPFQAQIALQELLEFSIEYNKSCQGCDCDCDCDDSEENFDGVTIPIFPTAFEEMSTPECEDTDDETINDIIQCCIKELEDNLEQDAIEISVGNVLVIVNRKITSIENGDEDCCGCDSYSYDVKVCKNYYEFIGDPDFCEICKMED
jgi:hypothetical protein